MQQLVATSVIENTNVHKAFESSVPGQNCYYSPLCLAKDCLKTHIFKNDSEVNMDIHRDCFKGNNWGVLKAKISPKVFAISLCLDLKRTFYNHYIQ